MIHIVLYSPQIPPNTGNIGRLCAYTNTRLHLIEPLGFQITQASLRRAGMDYWHQLDVHIHSDWQAFLSSSVAPSRLWLLTSKAKKTIWQATFADGDGLVFGNEPEGSPMWLHTSLAESRLLIPSFSQELRCLNLATAAGIALYEGLRQLHTPMSDSSALLSA